MDIIFFAAITFFILFKLRKQLGQIDEDEKRRIEENAAKMREEILKRVQAKQEKSNTPTPDQTAGIMRVLNPASETEQPKLSSTAEKALEVASVDAKQSFLNILKSCNISADFFLHGTNSAFEMVIKAFSQGDVKTLEFLLSKKVFNGFEEAINHRKSSNETLVTNLIAIDKTEIVSAATLEKTASIAVKFSSRQISYITDNTGEIIKGKKDKVIEMHDIWTFQKDITSNNPNWIITALS